jgi:hypothetical protein
LPKNIQLLKDRGWMGILLLYKSGSRAVLSIEKGAAGLKAFDEAFAQWASAPTAASGQKR